MPPQKSFQNRPHNRNTLENKTNPFIGVVLNRIKVTINHALAMGQTLPGNRDLHRYPILNI